MWPGAVVGTVLFQMLVLRRCRSTCASPTSCSRCARSAASCILLVWLYLMANIIVLGAEINWWHWSRRQPPTEEELANRDGLTV